MTMIAEDATSRDEGLEDEVVSENIEGSSLEEKIERSTMTHRFLEKDVIADIVSAVNRLGFINGDER
jgi:hypothetical protein